LEFNSKDYISSLHEASKSTVEGQALMDAKYSTTDVYNFDEIKKWFCRIYRSGEENLRSCDAYYQDDLRNYLVMEFKNTHHFKMKDYISEIAQKCTDTHLILAETFWRNRKAAEIGKKVILCLVYNDGISYGAGVQGFCKNINRVKPKQGSGARKSKEPVIYKDEQEYQKEIQVLKDTYEKDFYKEIMFLEKKEFCEVYADNGYFQKLV